MNIRNYKQIPIFLKHELREPQKVPLKNVILVTTFQFLQWGQVHNIKNVKKDTSQ